MWPPKQFFLKKIMQSLHDFIMQSNRGEKKQNTWFTKQNSSTAGQNWKYIVDRWNAHGQEVYVEPGWRWVASSVQSLSIVWLCNFMNHSTPGLPVHHQLPEFTQTHVQQISDAIQPSHLLSSPSPPAPNPSQHQGLFQLVNSSHEVAKVLEFQLQHQSFQWTPRTDFL